jgi:hypothetical protein
MSQALLRDALSRRTFDDNEIIDVITSHVECRIASHWRFPPETIKDIRQDVLCSLTRNKFWRQMSLMPPEERIAQRAELTKRLWSVIGFGVKEQVRQFAAKEYMPRSAYLGTARPTPAAELAKELGISVSEAAYRLTHDMCVADHSEQTISDMTMDAVLDVVETIAKQPAIMICNKGCFVKIQPSLVATYLRNVIADSALPDVYKYLHTLFVISGDHPALAALLEPVVKILAPSTTPSGNRIIITCMPAVGRKNAKDF